MKWVSMQEYLVKRKWYNDLEEIVMRDPENREMFNRVMKRVLKYKRYKSNKRNKKV